ncbi:hypothetical protein EVAR_93343_1 [Eumeta japonica]|uniref:Uncharacterized protein n=1 Tax=Eumeta variegata TaxID=151549 RepID=A0A4C1UU86_EUMVA|nr:hypothetical protein EVAR_93343_1 [Eumeta japonica]
MFFVLDADFQNRCPVKAMVQANVSYEAAQGNGMLGYKLRTMPPLWLRPSNPCAVVVRYAEMVTVTNDSVKKRGMKVNVSKVKVIVFEKDETGLKTIYYTCTRDERIEQEKEFVYLGSLFTNDDKYDTDIERQVNTRSDVNGVLIAIMNSKCVSRQARLAIHNEFLIPTFIMVTKFGYGIRKMKVKLMRWRCDLCVIYMECLRKIDVGTVMSESDVV